MDATAPDLTPISVMKLRLSGFCGGLVVLVPSTEPDGGVSMLNAGADHVIGFDTHPEQLRARLAALQRRIESTWQPPHPSPPSGISPHHLQATPWNVSDIALTARELGVLAVLTRNRDRVVTRHQLLREVWGFPPEAKTNVLTMCVSSIRRKLRSSEAPCIVRTIRGTGYILHS
ncbi:winged-helix domain-containing protein [Rhodococcus sp. NPDC057529]|uniref:winged helix-turn-helix transcriptional regulator n=1 Tax=Rhodococcus sp. NPDC057529 TaxID=3346158 RepID=UPI0036701964